MERGFREPGPRRNDRRGRGVLARGAGPGGRGKVFAWLYAGTKMVAVINPRQRSATVYKSPTDITALAEADVVDGEDIVPSFELAVREIFS